MNLIELSKYLNDEELAEKYLLEKEILKTWTHCPHCNSDKLGKISRSRIKCYKCKKEWNNRTNSILQGKIISAAKFLALVKLIADGNNLVMISKELELDKRIVYKFSHEINQLVMESQQIQIKNGGNFILTVSEGKLFINDDKLPDFSKIPHMQIEPIRFKKFGNIYSFLLNSKWKGRKTDEYQTIISFLSFIKMKSVNYLGISDKFFIEYLCSMVFQFNEYPTPYFESIVKLLHFSKVVKSVLAHGFDNFNQKIL